MDVSVIIPLHNRARLIPFTLDSVAARRHPDVRLEVIVVDDDSTDGGAELVERCYPDAVVLRQPGRGAPAARNTGLAVASGSAAVLLDSDDLLEPGYFVARVAALEAHPDADGAYGPWEHFAGEDGFSDAAVVPRWEPYPIDQDVDARRHLIRLLAGWYIAPHAILWRTAALRRVGGQDTGLTINQDVDLLFRVLLSGAGIVGCCGARALYRDHPGPRQGVVGTSERKGTDMYRLRRRFVEALERAGALDGEARQALARFCFDRWAELRHDLPDVAGAFLVLSRELAPKLPPRGRWPLRVLARLVGARRAVEIRDRLRAR